MGSGYTTTSGFYDSPVMLGAKRIKKERRNPMPIAGLTDINRPPRQGMLRLGIKKKTEGGKEYPSEVDYFILDPETPDPVEKARLIKAFHEAFGEKPKTIAVTLPYSDLDEVFPQNYKRYGRNTSLKCIGDGKEAVCTEQAFSQGLKSIGYDERGHIKVECKGRDCVFATTNEKSTAKECKATATLSVKIHPLGGVGVWQVTTGSFNSIVNINSCIRDLIDVYGRAHALPLVLERRPQETTFKGKKTTHYTLHINTDKSIVEMVRQAQIAPEMVLIEAYGKEVGALPAPAEIMDAETNTEPEKTIEAMDKEAATTTKEIEENNGSYPTHPEKLTSNWPGDTQNALKKIQEKVKANPADDYTKLTEYDKTTEKVLSAFSGTPVDEQSKEFLEGCKKDAKEELGTDNKKLSILNPNPQEILDKCKKIVFPEPFGKFMAFCKKQLDAVSKGDMYKDAFHLYSVTNAADLEKDTKKQADMRKYLQGLVEEECVE